MFAATDTALDARGERDARRHSVVRQHTAPGEVTADACVVTRRADLVGWIQDHSRSTSMVTEHASDIRDDIASQEAMGSKTRGR